MRNLPRAVWILGLGSFFTDFSSEMIYPLLPLFLSQVLGAGALALGVIEGVAESTAALVKVASGYWSDRSRRRKPLILAGYGLAGAVRPLIALASSWPMVGALRFLDRVGKGIRSSPRDALLADVVEADQRGQAYGVHRAMDHAGAVVGPLVAAALLTWGALDLRQVFLWAAVPAILAFLVLWFGVAESRLPLESTQKDKAERMPFRTLDPRFKKFLVVLLLFTLGNSADAFLLLRLREVGIPAGLIATLWALHHVIKMISTAWAGYWSDRWGRMKLIITGWIFYALIYGGFAVVEARWGLTGIFLAYGIYFGLTEPTERALVADLAGATHRGTVFGYYHFVVGMGALPASLLFGFLWHRFGSATAFFVGAGLAVAASAGLIFSGSTRDANPNAGVRTPRDNRA